MAGKTAGIDVQPDVPDANRPVSQRQ